MKVSFRQSGGFAGLSKGCDLDTQQMPAEEAAHLESLVEQSRLPDSINEHASQARDIIYYLITINASGHIRRVSVDDRTLPESARPLLRFLQQCAKPRPRC
jgi:hypothetical protein